jgi:hypothetical protein
MQWSSCQTGTAIDHPNPPWLRSTDVSLWLDPETAIATKTRVSVAAAWQQPHPEVPDASDPPIRPCLWAPSMSFVRWQISMTSRLQLSAQDP